jgi:hypothetical protein
VTAQTLFAALGFAVCVVLLVRMAIGQHRRDRLDAGLQRTARALHRRGRALWQRRRLRGEVQREAEDLIERARRGQNNVGRAGRVERDGNVYRPRSFNGSGAADDDRPADGRHRRDH